jgi:YegS/Rv2252/BmrU family lipid kinase
MKALVILKEDAGKNGHEAAADTVEREFTAAGIDFELVIATKKDLVDNIIRDRVGEGFDLVVAGGGDGTVSRACCGLQGTNIPLAILPIGTGNIVARELNIPIDVEGAVRVITESHRTTRIDAMKIGKAVYVLSAGVGINAAVIARTTRKSKHRFGRLAYVVGILRMLGFRPRRVEVTVDGTIHRHRAVEVAVNNCGTLARAVYPRGPEIRVDDGRLDVWVLGMETLADYLQYLAGLVLGRRKKALFFTARKHVVINSPVTLTAQADGDIIGTTPLEVEVLPSALTVLVPRETK